MKNRVLIEKLKKERQELYPFGYPTQQARGSGKTYFYLGHFLRYTAFDIVIDKYEKMDREVSLEEAHKDMNDFIEEMWALIKEDF